MNAEIGILISNNRDSSIFHWCLDNDVEVRHISSKTHHGEENSDETMQTVLADAGSELVVCSGYMKKIGPVTLEKFSRKILNIHPALLPKHGGKGMYGDRVHAAVLKAGETESGASVHYVTEGYDEGPVIRQKTVAVKADDTVEILRQRVQSIEARLYIESIQEILALRQW